MPQKMKNMLTMQTHESLNEITSSDKRLKHAHNDCNYIYIYVQIVYI